MKILFVSLGCDKNLVDSEKMLGMLQEKGYTFTDDEAEADVVVVNTCCFIGDAKEESINTLLQMGELKDSGQVKAVDKVYLIRTGTALGDIHVAGRLSQTSCLLHPDDSPLLKKISTRSDRHLPEGLLPLREFVWSKAPSATNHAYS